MDHIWYFQDAQQLELENPVTSAMPTLGLPSPPHLLRPRVPKMAD